MYYHLHYYYSMCFVTSLPKQAFLNNTGKFFAPVQGLCFWVANPVTPTAPNEPATHQKKPKLTGGQPLC